MRVMKRLGALVAVAVLAALVLPAPAQGDSGDPGASLVLTVSAVGSHQVYTAHITCHPTSGPDHKHYFLDEACTHLTQAGGDFEALPGLPWLGCDSHGPARHTTATGHWFGQPVDYDKVHPSLCDMLKDTGNVFRF
jgi:hypothetical protein